MPFTIDFDGEQFKTSDLTIADAVTIEKETEESWLFINPLRSAAHWRAISRVFLLRAGKDAAEVATMLDATPIDKAVAATEHVDDDLPDSYEDGIPNQEAGPSTSTSSPATVDSAGPLT